ncbi:MAG: hypothetical protein JXO22_12075 [Phycisphaerae bacterium]|nr:hypothetical protein [Phycisphaerae bacterium]
MNWRNPGLLLVSIVAFGLIIAAVRADDEEDEPRSGLSSLINTDVLIDNYIRVVVRKYNLNEQQAQFTEQLVRQQAKAFLDQHQYQLFPLVDRMFEVRAGGDISSQEMVDWGTTVLPIYEDARQIIVAANDGFREILDDEQRKIHDQDVKLMYESFDMTEEQLGKMVSGEMTVDEFRNPQRRRSNPQPGSIRSTRAPSSDTGNRGDVAPPPGQPRPATGDGQATVTYERPSTTETPSTESASRDRRRPGQPTRQQDPDKYESEWDKYVADFIERYSLNDAQTQKAHTILKSCKEQAAQLVRRNKSKIEVLDKQLADARKDKDTASEVAKLTKQRDGLLEPLTQIFERQLKPRLDKLPTRAQREAAEKPKPRPAAPAKEPATTGP